MRFIAPASEAELLGLIAAATPITIVGARTGLTGGCVPEPGSWAVSLERFQRLEICPGRAIVGPGVSLDTLQAADPKFISEEAHMIYARSLELQGKNDEAAAEYARLVPYYAGEEARARYAMLLDKIGRHAEARDLYAQILKNLDGAPSRYRSQQREWGVIAKNALK